MEKEKKFSLKKRMQSFKHAFNGLRILVREEHNSRIHIAVIFSVLLVGLILQLEKLEWCVILILFALVVGAELFNSSIENLCDFITLERNESIKKIKDLAAAGVFVTALAAFVIGAIIFFPKITNLLSQYFTLVG